MIKYFIVAFIVVECYGCCSPQYVERSELDTVKVPVPTEESVIWGDVVDTTKIPSFAPIVFESDSAHKGYHINLEVAVDSGKWRVKYKITHDSIPYPVEVTKWLPQEKESYPFLSKLGIILIGLVAGTSLGLLVGKKSLISIGKL